MKVFTSLSDYNYLPLGLSLYESLAKNTKDEFILYYLCLDRETYHKLHELNQSGLGIIPILIDDLISENSDLSSYNKREYREFVWMLASYFTHYILITKKPDNVSYIDADIFLYGDIQMMYDEIGDNSVGIIRHRHIELSANTIDGKYNVGIVYFKNDVIGRHLLDWWKDAVLYRKYPQLATCYDQKYLEAFEMMYPQNVCIVDKSFAHSAPWHHRLYDWSDYLTDSTITWNNQKQILLFNHFSRISFDTKKGTYLPSGGQYGDHTQNFEVFNIPAVKKIHDDYFEEIKKVNKKYNL
jgi:hypothetical protein